MKHIPIAVIIITLFAGCASTPTGDIEAFGNATKKVTEKIDGVIDEYNTANINNELEKLAQRKKPISVGKLDPVRAVIIRDADKKDYALYKANRALGSYADALSGLAKSGTREEIDLAATQLYGALHNFNEQYKTLKGTSADLVSDETSSSIGKAIAAIGGAYAEKKRGDAIKLIVIEADPYVQSIGDVIIDQFLKGVIEQRLYTIKNTELGGYIKDYNSSVSTASISEKRRALAEIYEKYLQMQSSSASVSQAVKAVNAVKSAHTTLRKEVEKDKFTSKEIVEAIGELEDLASHYDELEALMLSCETKIIPSNKGLICKPKS